MATYGVDEAKNRVEVYDKNSLNSMLATINQNISNQSSQISDVTSDIRSLGSALDNTNQAVTNLDNKVTNVISELGYKLNKADIQTVQAGQSVITVGAGLSSAIAIAASGVTAGGTTIIDVLWDRGDGTFAHNVAHGAAPGTTGVGAVTSAGIINLVFENNLAAGDWTVDLSRYYVRFINLA